MGVLSYPLPPSGLAYKELKRLATRRGLKPPPVLAGVDVVDFRKGWRDCRVVWGRAVRLVVATPFLVMVCDEKGDVRHTMPMSWVAGAQYALDGHGSALVLVSSHKIHPSRIDVPDIVVCLSAADAEAFCRSVVDIRVLRGEAVADDPSCVLECPKAEFLRRKATLQAEGYSLPVTRRELLNLDIRARQLEVAGIGMGGVADSPASSSQHCSQDSSVLSCAISSSDVVLRNPLGLIGSEAAT
eukprot:Rhum_TRINITY_DN21140_c0_g1::Rhum_TRINITY_DN21140_c0_g1_i1::g.173222::m.173222